MNKVILNNKPKLIKWLSVDLMHILQHVQAKELITMPEYDELKSVTVPRDRVVKLLDIILGKGENVCRDFLILLKDDDVNEISPELRNWIKTVDTSETANTVGQSGIQVTKTANTVGQSGIQVTSKISASDCSNVNSPIITGATLGSFTMNVTNAPSGKSNVPANCQKPDRDWEGRENGNRPIQDYQKLLKANTSHLVQNVKNIDAIIDDLKFLHKESIANVRAKPTRQKMMRELLDCVNCKSSAKELVDALFNHEPDLMKDLQY